MPPIVERRANRPDTVENRVIDYAAEHEGVPVDWVVAQVAVREGVDPSEPTDEVREAAQDVLDGLVERGLLRVKGGGYLPTWQARQRLKRDRAVASKHNGETHVKRPVNAGSDSSRVRSEGGRFGARDAGPELAPLDRVKELMGRAAKIESAGGLSDESKEAMRLVQAVHGADDWRIAIPAMFPGTCTKPFAPHQEELLEWASTITEKMTPRPYTSFWARGHAKSSLSEMVCVYLAHRRVRKYCLYVSGKQTKADDHVAAIGDLLESEEIATIDRELSEREVNKYGSSKGWRRNRLTTKAGFTVDAVGLDSDVRGARIGKQRPDLIIFDDCDGSADSLATIEKKIERITKDLIPTQDPDGVAIMFVQNIIHHQSIAARLAEIEGAPRIDMLTRRIISGPIKAINGLEFKEEFDEEYDRNRFVITAGTPTWDGYGIEACQHMIDNEGLTAFLSECQHEEGTLKGGMFDHIDFAIRRRTRAQLPALRDNGVWIGKCGTWVDPAVTSTNRSDSCAMVTAGLGVDKKYWMLDSWEAVTSPTDALLRGLESAMRWGSQVLGVETDQGGDTWEVVYRAVVREQLEDPESYVFQRHMEDHVPIPTYDERKAGAEEGNPSKRQRMARMLARYDTDAFRHLDEGTRVLEAGLGRFPKYKPFDIADAAFWAWKFLGDAGGESVKKGFRARASRGGSIGYPAP